MQNARFRMREGEEVSSLRKQHKWKPHVESAEGLRVEDRFQRRK